MDDNQQLDLDKICRLCLEEKRTMRSLFSAVSDGNLSLDQRIMAFASIQIREGDGLPSQICTRCVSSVIASYQFKTLVENSDRALQEFLQFQAEVKDQNKTCDMAIKEEEEDLVDTDDDGDDIPIHEFLETTLANVKTRKTKKLSNKPERHSCEDCGKILGTRKTLIRHCLVQHDKILPKQIKTYDCFICFDKFDKWTQLVKHEKELKHYGRVKCPYCQKLFARTYMQEHIRHHTGERPFLCTYCGHSFAQVSSFYKHKKLCSNAEKKFQCSFCDKKFHEKFTLTEHERIHTNERPYVCETCGKAFRRKSKMVIHQLSHTNIKPHKCSVCERAFRQRVHLTEHLRIHSGVKPFRCDICGAAFTQGHSLKSHRIKHTVG